MDLLKLEKKTIKAVKKAAKLFNHNHIDITEKGGASNIVTTADINIQHFLQKELKKIIKDSGFLGEEESLSEIDSDYYWIIDPIDGTANFSRLISECVISVALMHKNEPIVAVVYAPWKNLLWSARKDCGAYLNGERIHSSDRDFSHSLFCTSLTPYDKSLAKVCSDIILEAYPLCNDIRRFGACAIWQQANAIYILKPEFALGIMRRLCLLLKKRMALSETLMIQFRLIKPQW